MKKLLLSIIFLGLFSGLSAQEFSLGPKFGLSSTKVDFKENNFIPGDAQTGYHVGLFGRIGFGGFYLQPEVLYTKTNGTFQINGPQPGGGTGTSTFSQDFNRLDIPLMLGVKLFKFFRIQAGPIASINIDSDLKDANNTVRNINYNDATLGYQAGVGLDIGALIVDAKYESSLSSITKNIGGFQTDQRINQFILSVGFKLF
jgi:hypothetical protein